jgi:CubicO group peptidase (beta-lactamase class C family)
VTNQDGLDRAALARIDQIVEQAVEQGQAPGVVAAVARGPDMHVATAGAMAVGGAAMRRDTLFRISSITKPMTAAVVLSLVEDGLLDLNGPIDELAPELADRRVLRRPDGPLDLTVPAQRPITVRDLLTFTWGFGMQGAMFIAPEPWPIVSAAAERGLATFGSGTAWSNVPAQDLTVVVLTQRAVDETGPPAVCEEVLAAAREAG